MFWPRVLLAVQIVQLHRHEPSVMAKLYYLQQCLHCDLDLFRVSKLFINLQKENITNNIFIVGNTVLDNLKYIYPILGSSVLVTLHRRENLDIIDKWFLSIEKLAYKNPNLQFIFPMHPNPQIQKFKNIFKSVNVIDPLSYDKCIELLSQCGLGLKKCTSENPCPIHNEFVKYSEQLKQALATKSISVLSLGVAKGTNYINNRNDEKE